VLVRIIVGMAITAAAFTLAGRRVLVLYRLARAGQPAEPGRTDGLGTRLWALVVEVFGQRKLLKWSGAGAAHFAVFWGFVILGATILEGYGALFDRDFHIPLIGTDAWLGALEDTFIVAVLAGLIGFAAIRLRQSPEREGRRSRFFGSHLGAAWLTLLMIFNVMWTLLLYRGAQINTGNFPFPHGAYASQTVGHWLHPAGRTANDVLETVGLLGSLAVVLSFLVFVVHSKHLHIFLAPLNVAASRRPRALGPLLPVYSGGAPVDFEDPGEDDKIGRGAIEDFTWKGLLDFGTCTECGRCQSQCPAWNTGKPLSPKLLIMGLRDHALANAPYLLAKARSGYRAGHDRIIDHMLMDGLEDAYESGRSMGDFGEATAEAYQFTRKDQDTYAMETLTRARKAVEGGAFKAEIAPITLTEKAGPRIVANDEHPLKVDPAKIPALRPAFRANGTITPAASSANADGAAALILAKRSLADRNGLPVLAEIKGHATHSQEPQWFTTAPIPAIRKLLDKVGWSVGDVDLFEINEAFAVVAMAAAKDLGIPRDKLNINGGACALGHPIGATGARLIVTLLHALEANNLKRGIASLCIGGGEATAIAVERVMH